MPGDNTWWGADSGANYTVLYGLVGAGIGQGEARDDIRDTDVLRAREKVEYVSSAFRPDTFILRDLNDTAVQVGASLSTNGTLTLDSGSGWEGELLAPVTLYGALIEAERGEIVTGEIIGVGDASIPNQTFALKKFPLTFVNAPSSASTTGVASTLVVRVNHILWREVERFYGRRADETIYTVRTDGDGKATITFGDGVRGARLPSGAVIVADYRFGAGAAAPPANSITQIVTPVKGVSAQRNPIAAYGGSDAESETGLKTYAPKSALMLGRAVSLVDYEATAAATSGVLSAQATWAWSRAQQRPVVQVAYIGAGELGADILERLTMISAVGVPFLVVAATPIALNVYVSIEIDPLYTSDSVITAVTDALAAALLPEVLGVGGMLIRSDVLEIAARIDGVVAPLNVTIDGKPFAAAGMKAQPDEYFAISVMVGGNT
jgi:predicted phage baseplate assembly protein